MKERIDKIHNAAVFIYELTQGQYTISRQTARTLQDTIDDIQNELDEIVNELTRPE